MPLEHLPATATVEDVVASMRRHGGVVIDDLSSPEVMDRISTEMEPWMQWVSRGTDHGAGTRTRRAGNLISRSPTSHHLITHPLVVGVARRLIRASEIHLQMTQIISIEPGEIAGPIHRDESVFDAYEFPVGFEAQIGVMWALTEFNETNGGTRIMPGSHLYPPGFEYHYKEEDTEWVEMAKGSLLLWSGKTYHGPGANKSDRTRSGLRLPLCPAWMMQEENQFLTVPLQLAQRLDPELLRLMGYARSCYGLNYVDDMRDPMELVRPDLAGPRGYGDIESRMQQNEEMAAFFDRARKDKTL